MASADVFTITDDNFQAEVLASNGKIHAELIELFQQIVNGNRLERLPQIQGKII